MRYYFYCPNCGLEQEGLRFEDLPKDKVGNLRDGFGRPIYHYECPVCGNLDAGAMAIETDADSGNWEQYYRSVIKMYQGIRGFAKKMKENFDYAIFLLSSGAFWNIPQTQDNGRYFRGGTIIGNGACGFRVKLLQKQLIRLGYVLPVYGIDGIYGGETRKAVTEFQMDHGLIPDGLVGLETITKLKGDSM